MFLQLLNYAEMANYIANGEYIASCMANYIASSAIDGPAPVAGRVGLPVGLVRDFSISRTDWKKTVKNPVKILVF